MRIEELHDAYADLLLQAYYAHDALGRAQVEADHASRKANAALDALLAERAEAEEPEADGSEDFEDRKGTVSYYLKERWRESAVGRSFIMGAIHPTGWNIHDQIRLVKQWESEAGFTSTAKYNNDEYTIKVNRL